ncbi:TetR family transcriptional regulator [Pacificimonas flava]|uniref:TetR family transcriptional regulator n=2 Tax=Pacificimonas TaxID=1960290 RepID=A0A219B7K7_9SPHN|nr:MULTISPECIES: TetR/AcrR family transcriptional regulator [Pacificimonas]MBZ6379820.1 TetR/AcrR family transcriptional regulator [Pacificimonas aurantium]OWV34355.1 TetR family transcriptional regulator [Pacificimonas flava]
MSDPNTGRAARTGGRDAPAPAAKPPGKRERAKSERRLRIVRAARDLIRETGDTDLSMRALAERAEVSLGTPYNLFGSKRAVVLAVLEDERDFVDRFFQLKVDNSLERVFAAHDLAFSYYLKDPDFYRTLWRALLERGGQDETGLASPERLAQTREIWISLLGDAVRDGYLSPPFSLARLEEVLEHLVRGALLSWVMGNQQTETLSTSVGLGYALCLAGMATDSGAPILARRLQVYGSELDGAAHKDC